MPHKVVALLICAFDSEYFIISGFWSNVKNIIFVGCRENEMTEQELNILARRIPTDKYYELAHELGTGYNSAEIILKNNGNNYEKAMRKVFQSWFDRTPLVRRKSMLKTCMEKVELTAIIC